MPDSRAESTPFPDAMHVQRMLALWVAQESRYGLVFLDPNGAVTAITPAAQRLLGYAQAELVGRPLSTFFTRGDQALQLPLHEMEVARKLGYSEDDRWHRRKDGSLVWIGGSLTRLLDEQGRVCGFVKIMRDRTDVRIQIETLNNRASRHEQPQLAQVRKLRLAKVHLQGVLADVILAWRPAADAAGVSLEMLAPIGVIELVADMQCLQQMVGHLVSNAIKYTPAGGNVWVKATLEGESAVVRVEDNGAGIGGHVLPEIFGVFTHDGRSSPVPSAGSGAGLKMVHELVLLHGGTIEVRSGGAGKGCDFGIRLPVAGPVVR